MRKFFSQHKGIDFEDVVSPIAKHTIIRVLLALSVQLSWRCHQIDIKIAFLNGKFDEEICMRQSEGFVDAHNPTHVCRLLRSLYWLKQSARCWNERLHLFLLSVGYVQVPSDGCLYRKVSVSLIISVYVDNIVIFCCSLEKLFHEKTVLKQDFALTDHGEVHRILGMLVKKAENSWYISQAFSSAIVENGCCAVFNSNKDNQLDLAKLTKSVFIKIIQGSQTVPRTAPAHRLISTTNDS